MARNPLWALLLAVPALMLAGCNKADDAATNGAVANAVAAVPAPAGTRWSEQVVETPEGGVRMGNPNAALKVIEYGSFTCPHCRDFAKEGDELLASKYVDSGKVSFEYRSFIRDPIDLTVALVARCGGPSTFFAMAQQLFGNQDAMFATLKEKGDAQLQKVGEMPPAQRFQELALLAGLIDFAKARGLPEPQLRACLSDKARAEGLAKVNDAAIKTYNVSGTPTLILNNSVLEGVATWEAFETRLRNAGA
jgi:protein-disulfide isomerase